MRGWKSESSPFVGQGTTEGWAALGSGFSKQKPNVQMLQCFKTETACARVEDLKAIFDVALGWIVTGGKTEERDFVILGWET